MRRLLEQKVAATPMVGRGGPITDRHVRFVFGNEPVGRLTTLGDRVRAALDARGRRDHRRDSLSPGSGE